MKYLVTGGCSFSECISLHVDTWPRHLARAIPDYTHVSTAISSMGNGLISRRVIAVISDLLSQNVQSSEILVGIMWSGFDRHEVYNTSELFEKNEDGWMINPVNVVKHVNKNWYILNHHWKNDVAVQYYKYHYNQTFHIILTLEHILRVQWFLQSVKIKFFMSTFTDDVLNSNCIINDETKHLFKLINFGNFLPVTSMLGWCKQNYKLF